MQDALVVEDVQKALVQGALGAVGHPSLLAVPGTSGILMGPKPLPIPKIVTGNPPSGGSERETERERERASDCFLLPGCVCVYLYVCVCVCVCVCVRIACYFHMCMASYFHNVHWLLLLYMCVLLPASWAERNPLEGGGACAQHRRAAAAGGQSKRLGRMEGWWEGRKEGSRGGGPDRGTREREERGEETFAGRSIAVMMI